jgi:ABC-type enterochelin transport system substrate-binding protein
VWFPSSFAAEILFALNAKQAWSRYPALHQACPGWEKSLIGGYFSPNWKAIESLAPDLIIAAPHHLKSLPETGAIAVLVFDTRSLADAEADIEMLGRIFNKEARARAIIDHNHDQFTLLQKKISLYP